MPPAEAERENATPPPGPTQAGPAGNAHPESESVSGSGQLVANPFGRPTPQPALTVQQRVALSEALDLKPLRDLAVLHNGRVKILDTLARETVANVTGRNRYQEFVEDQSGGGALPEKVSFDPMFTLLDFAIDTGYYVDKPVVYVNFLPLREAYLDMAFPEDKQLQRRWKKFTRVTPLMVERFSTPIVNAHMGESTFLNGVKDVESRQRLFLLSVNNLMLIAPESKDKRWYHVSEWPDGSPVREVFAELGRAWRAGDADATNAAIRSVAEIVPTINAEIYPTSRRSLELTYNQVNAFEWGYWAYLLSLLALVLAFGTGRKWLIVSGIALLTLAIGLHGFGFIMRSILAERFAIQNQFESMTGLSLFATLVGAVIMIARKQWLFGAAAAGCGFLVLVFATQTGIPGQTIAPEAAILNTSVLLKYHVTTVLTSYGLITLGMFVSLFYLGTHYGAKLFGKSEMQVMSEAALAGGGAITGGGGATGPDGDGGSGGGAGDRPPTLARTLADLDSAQMIILQLAFWTLGVGTLLGAWWADHSWGRWWAFDPKETWALITWIVYLIVIHVRFATKNKALVTAWLSVIGFIVMLWTYFGVNLLLPGLHAYA